MNPVVICLTEQTHLDWNGRHSYIKAKFEKRKTELYAMDMVWLLAKKYYDIQTQQPTKYELDHRPVDRRNAKQIKESLVKRLKGT